MLPVLLLLTLFSSTEPRGRGLLCIAVMILGPKELSGIEICNSVKCQMLQTGYEICNPVKCQMLIKLSYTQRQ